jgi:hypothetical protein
LRSHQLLSYSKMFQNCMEPGSSLSCSQEPRHWCLSQAKSNKFVPSHSLTSISFLSLRLLRRLPSVRFPSAFLVNPLYAFLFSPMCTYIPFLSYLPLLLRSNYLSRRVRVMNFLARQIFQIYFFPLRPKYVAHFPVLKCFSPIFFP